MTTIGTCLWFDGRIDEAAEFYVSLVEDSRILQRTVYEAGGYCTVSSVGEFGAG